MERGEVVGAKRTQRVHRSVAEKRRIVELVLQLGVSVARVAQSEGVNANQVFKWRREDRNGAATRSRFYGSMAMHSVRSVVLHREWCARRASASPESAYSVASRVGMKTARADHDAPSAEKMSYWSN